MLTSYKKNANNMFGDQIEMKLLLRYLKHVWRSNRNEVVVEIFKIGEISPW
jgi:hypothetical protein